MFKSDCVLQLYCTTYFFTNRSFGKTIMNTVLFSFGSAAFMVAIPPQKNSIFAVAEYVLTGRISQSRI